MRTKSIAGAIGKGLLAGLAGTAAMTLSSTIEMKRRGREGSDAPAQAAGKVLGIDPDELDEETKTRFSNAVHWSYGTGWGAVRGLLASSGLRGASADAAHFGAVWGSEQIMLPALDVAPPLTEWGLEEIAIDTAHHVVYVAATGLAYRMLDR
jgi:hypothetical protein